MLSSSCGTGFPWARARVSAASAPVKSRGARGRSIRWSTLRREARFPGCAHDAIAALLLGAIERRVGALDRLLDGFGRPVLRHADRHGDPVRAGHAAHV